MSEEVVKITKSIARETMEWIICIVVAIALHPVMYLALDDNNNDINDELEEGNEKEVSVYQKDEDAIKNKRER